MEGKILLPDQSVKFEKRETKIAVLTYPGK